MRQCVPKEDPGGCRRSDVQIGSFTGPVLAERHPDVRMYITRLSALLKARPGVVTFFIPVMPVVKC
jgi:hypothetical protein